MVPLTQGWTPNHTQQSRLVGFLDEINEAGALVSSVFGLVFRLAFI